QPDALLWRRTLCGTDLAGGGAFERPFISLGVFGSDGLLTRLEYFDTEREVEALARFDELAAPVRRRVRSNAATAHATRAEAAIAAGDADALPAMYADESEGVDHTTGATLDRQGILGSFRALLKAENPTLVPEMLATL